jgi:hypothetical protein
VEVLAKACPEALLEKTNTGWTPVHVAAQHASAEVVEVLAKACPEALLEKTNTGWTPVHVAAAYASAEFVEVLAKACPEALLEKCNKGWTPVHVAAAYASAEVVEVLAKACPDALGVTTQNGELPVDVARRNEKADVAAWLEQLMDDARRKKKAGVAAWLDREEVRPSSSPGEKAVAADNSGQRPAPDPVNPQGWTRTQGVHQATSAPGSPSRRVDGPAPSPSVAIVEAGTGPSRPVPAADAAELQGSAPSRRGNQVRHTPGSPPRPVHGPAPGPSETAVEPGTSPSPPVPGAVDPPGSTPSQGVHQAESARGSLSRPVHGPAEGRRTPVDKVSGPVLHGAPGTLKHGVNDPHASDRKKVKDVIEQIVSEPPAVSPAYIESILLRDKQLGKGFFGTVYKGKDSVLGRSFAIKAINKDILKGGSSEDIQQAMQTFQREQEVCAKIFP